jgi:hypothetical protein
MTQRQSVVANHLRPIFSGGQSSPSDDAVLRQAHASSKARVAAFLNTDFAKTSELELLYMKRTGLQSQRQKHGIMGIADIVERLCQCNLMALLAL